MDKGGEKVKIDLQTVGLNLEGIIGDLVLGAEVS